MNRGTKILLVLLLFVGYSYAQSDSTSKANVFFNAGVQLNGYMSSGYKLSKTPIGYSFGIGIRKNVSNNTLLATSVNYMNLDYTDMNHSIIDPNLNEKVNILATINFKRVNFDNELCYYKNKLTVGLKAGLGVLFSAHINENITVDDTTYNGVNLYNKYIIYSQQESSLFKLIVPYSGLSVSYNLNRLLAIKYEFWVDVFKQPYRNFEFLIPFNSASQKLSLTINLKKK